MPHFQNHRSPFVGAAVSALCVLLSVLDVISGLLCLGLVALTWGAVAFDCKHRNRKKTRFFMRSGNSKAAKAGYELILKSKGKGDNYWTTARDLAFADLQDFHYVQGQNVSFKELLKCYPYTLEPYCLDDENHCVILVETPLAFDCAIVGPFYFSTQRSVARRLFSIPYAEYNEVCAGIANVDLKNLILLYNTSRCGSTLVSKAFDSMANIQSISEPDMFTSMTHIAMECGQEPSRMAELSELATSTGKLLLALRSRRYPDKPILALKFRFQVTYIAHLLKAALPGACSMFLYRNAADVVDSMAAAFISGFLYNLWRFLRLDSYYIFVFSSLDLHLPILMPLWASKLYPSQTFTELGGTSPFFMAWLSVMHKAQESLECGDIDLAFRYEDVVQDKGVLLMKVLEVAGFTPTPNERELTTAFRANSQEDSSAASRRRNGDGVLSEKFHYLRSDDLTKFQKLFARHPFIRSHHHVLPKTITVSEHTEAS